MTYTIDPELLEQSSRDLIRHGLDVDEATRIPFPDTGSTSGYSKDAIEQLITHVESTAGSLRDVGEATERVVAVALAHRWRGGRSLRPHPVLGVPMSVDTAVDGDPGSCRRTARRLHDLHGELAEARAYLDGQARLDPARFDGRSGDAYRARCAAIGRTVDAAAQSCRGLGRALNEYADGLDEVLAVMARARDLARRELVLHGHVDPHARRLRHRPAAAALPDRRRRGRRRPA